MNRNFNQFSKNQKNIPIRKDNKMHFVNVIGTVPTDQMRQDIAQASISITGKTLISIIGGLKQKNFGFDTLLKTSREFKRFQNEYVKNINGELFADSGGYSIIAGDVHPSDIDKFTKCYTKFFELEHQSVNTFFSLDIPIFLKDEYKKYNTKKNIYEFNRQSLIDAKTLLEENSEIRKKFNFVWHFKILEQYEIWSKLYEELGLSKLIKRRSIGGMVGLPKITGKRFAPFIALSFRCLFDHQEGAYPDKTFNLHLLGIKSKTDRFAIEILESLFTRYLAGIANAKFTYDSINVNRNAQFNARNLETFSFENGEINRYGTIFDIPNNIINQVYFTETMKKTFQDEISNLRNGRNLNSSDNFSPLGIYSNIHIDNYFLHIIERYQIIDMLFNNTSIIQVKYSMKSLLIDLSLKQPGLFTKHFQETLLENIEWIFRFHNWYRNNRNKDSLDEIIAAFIEEINFPFHLT